MHAGALNQRLTELTKEVDDLRGESAGDSEQLQHMKVQSCPCRLLPFLERIY